IRGAATPQIGMDRPDRLTLSRERCTSLRTLLAAFLAVLFVGACAPVQQPAWRLPATPAPPPPAPAPLPGILEPSGSPARRYNDGGPAVPATPLIERVEQIMRESAGTPPVIDGRLCAVAGELAALADDAPPPYDAEEFALAFHGIIEPSPHLLVIRMTDGDD